METTNAKKARLVSLVNYQMPNNLKGFLADADGMFQLAPKVTTIGREGCDFVIKSPSVDFQHAVIEFSEQEQCYVLQDLNSQQGTYVNDCRVQNAAVRLAPGDVIRFGYGGMPYELQQESTAQMTYPPVHQRPAWTTPLALVSDMSGEDPCSGLPLIKPESQSQSSSSWGNSPNGHQTAMPLPPRPPSSVRTRPLSAGSAGRRSERVQTPFNRSGMTSCMAAGASPARTISGTNLTTIINQEEKDQHISLLSDEVVRLQTSDAEKDAAISRMREEVGDLQSRLRECDTRWVATEVVRPPTERDEIVTRLAHEAAEKRAEMEKLQQEIARLKSQSSLSRAMSTANGRASTELQDRVLEVNSLRSELERVQKDKNIMSGLVTQMQRDMSNKDVTISRMTKEVENVKKEMEEKDIQIKALHDKFARSNEQRMSDAEVDMRERELAILKLKFKKMESHLQQQTDLVDTLRAELEKNKEISDNENMKHKLQQSEMDKLSETLQDLERAERVVRIDLEQANQMLQRMKMRVIQVAFCAPGTKAPEKELTEDELLDALSKMVEEHMNISRQLATMQTTMTKEKTARKELMDSSKKLKQQVSDTPAKLSGIGLLSSQLRHQVELLKCTSAEEPVVWMKDVIINVLQAMLTWEVDIEGALLEAGFNVNILNEKPAELLRKLAAQKEAAVQEVESVRARFESQASQHRDEIDVALAAQRDEMTTAHEEEVKLFKEEAKRQLDVALEELKASEAERMMENVEKEQLKIVELEANIEQLKACLSSNEEEQTANKMVAKEALERLAEGETREESLRQQLRNLETAQAEQTAQLQRSNEEAAQRNDAELTRSREQIKQHSLTICAMEERLNKAVKKNKDLQSENSRLKKSVQELKTKQQLPPPPAPRPLVLPPPAVDVAGLEALIAQLRSENAQLCQQQQLMLAQQQQQLQQHEATVAALRRDIAGSEARLSDMTGELSEAQKEKLESSRRKVVEQEAELTELRQQMAKLTSIIDKQSAEIEELNKDINKQKSALGKNKLSRSGHEARIAELERQLAKKEAESDKQISLIEDEGRISSELSALGAQCRGERHEQVITRQREALTELRARIKEAEHLQPPVPSHEQALHQVILLKKELCELQASRASHDRQITDGSDVLQRQISAARGIQPQLDAASQVERSAHRETMDSLETSEASYIGLLHGVATALEVDTIGGLQSMAHAPRDERLRLMAAREQACEQLTSRIAVLKERVARKDELLHGYERDLAKLRQAEMLAESKDAQVEHLAGDVRARTEETGYLRESLQRTRDKLEQEKRLNAAIKQKKTFHLENEQVSKNGWPKHYCVPNDVMAKESARKNLQKEKIKRKNYEIETLKGQLMAKEKDLHVARKKLTSKENGLVI